MRETLIDAARWFLPPVLFRAASALKRQLRPAPDNRIHFEGRYGTWEEASALCAGYGTQEIFLRVLDAARKVQRGDAPCERDGVALPCMEYSWPVMAALLQVALRHGGELNVVDFGGALGSSYRQARTLLQGTSRVRWGIVEQAHVVEAGQREFTTPELRFFTTLDAALQEQPPDCLLLSGVLPYMPHPHALLTEAAACNFDTIILDRTTMRPGREDVLCIQTVPASIYPARYPAWGLGRDRIVEVLADRFRLDLEFDGNEGLVDFAGLPVKYAGMVFRRREPGVGS